AIPAVDANHQRMCYAAGKRAVDMVWQDLKPTDILNQNAFENAIKVNMAIGGSTNAIIHLIAMAKRAGCDITIDSFDRIARDIPLLASVRPSGDYLMEDFYYAGGLSALMKAMAEKLELSSITVNGKTLGENIKNAEIHIPDVIRTLDNPVQEAGGTAVLRGNLAPDGAIIKPTAAAKHLLKHTGEAYVFENIAQLKKHIDDDDLPVTKDTVLVLKNGGPIGGPGMPEWGMLPIPKKLLKQGVRDMVRISDSRMSGTSYGACILHVAPEAAIGGPIALVQTGDKIMLDVEQRKLELLVSEAELHKRRDNFTPPERHYYSGYASMYINHVTQANQGCDFDFMNGEAGATKEPDIF
nr:dihydroxy-acid dehydratase [Alphaproteobacteria bacterium]